MTDANEEVFSDTVAKIIPHLREHKVKKAALFGSTARGEARMDSDIDLLISFSNPRYDLFDLAGLKLALEEALCVPVDIVTYSSLGDDEFSAYALSDERVIYEED